MNSTKLSRRSALARTTLLAGAAVLGRKLEFTVGAANAPAPREAPFLYSLNTATVRGQKLGIVKEIEVAAKAGYDGIEPWVESVSAYAQAGGSLPELKRRIQDAGLSVEGAISFPEWLVEDEARRAKGLERARRDMELMAKIGAKRFAAPPAGATGLPEFALPIAAERYRALLDASDQIGIVPELELWGFSKNLSRLGECVGVAMETGHPRACVLADVFHLYKGATQIEGIRLLGATAVQVLHMNDFPSEPSREKIDDSYRVYPGDGTAPLAQILSLLHQTGGQKVLSLELFNRKYWSEDPLIVAKTGLAKMKEIAAKALA